MDGEGWVEVSRPELPLRFRYPAVTPSGEAVQVVEDERGRARRVHLSAPESGELYLEVMWISQLAPRDEYVRHREYLEDRFGSGSVDELTETTFGALPAWAYRFRGGELERAVLAIPVGADLLRIISDPRVPLNDEIIATVRVDG